MHFAFAGKETSVFQNYLTGLNVAHNGTGGCNMNNGVSCYVSLNISSDQKSANLYVCLNGSIRVHNLISGGVNVATDKSLYQKRLTEPNRS